MECVRVFVCIVCVYSRALPSACRIIRREEAVCTARLPPRQCRPAQANDYRFFLISEVVLYCCNFVSSCSFRFRLSY
jgi:hypothetical protein